LAIPKSTPQQPDDGSVAVAYLAATLLLVLLGLLFAVSHSLRNHLSYSVSGKSSLRRY